MYCTEMGNKWTDCEFIVGESRESENKQSFKCHKIILAKSSTEFARMLYGEEAEQQPIIISNMHPEIFADLIKFLYTGRFQPENYSNALKLCYAAHNFSIQSLIEKATEFLWEKIQPNCACLAFEFAVSMNATKLMARSLKIIQHHTSEILSHPNFSSVKKSTLLTILQQEKLNITTELELIEASINWAKHEQLRLEGNIPMNEILVDILKEIRFLTLSLDDFARSISKIDILNAEEKIVIISNISTPNSMTLPENICKSTTKRVKPICTEPEFIFYDDVSFEHYIDKKEDMKSKPKGPIYISNGADIFIETSDKLVHVKNRIIETQIMFLVNQDVSLKNIELLLDFNDVKIVENKKSKETIKSEEKLSSHSSASQQTIPGTTGLFGIPAYSQQATTHPTTPVFGHESQCGAFPFHYFGSTSYNTSYGNLFGQQNLTKSPQQNQEIKSKEKYNITDLFILDSKFNKCYSFKKTNLMKDTENFFEIKFDEPIYLRKDDMYRIYVICKNDGFFPGQSFKKIETQNSNEMSVTNENNSIIKSLGYDPLYS